MARNIALTLALMLALLFVAACGDDDAGDNEATATAPATSASATSAPATGETADARESGTLVVTSTAFDEGGTIPAEYTCTGANTAPPLAWTGAPEGTASFAIIVDDPDAPREGGFDHWVMYDVPPDVTSFPAGSDAEALGAVAGANGTGGTTFIGSCPPPGDEPHRYRYHVYALDTTLELAEGATKQQVLDAMEGQVLADGVLTGLFGR